MNREQIYLKAMNHLWSQHEELEGIEREVVCDLLLHLSGMGPRRRRRRQRPPAGREPQVGYRRD